MANRTLFFVLACSLAANVVTQAGAGEPAARVACPEAWPGPEGRGAPLLAVRPWQDWQFMIDPWEEASAVAGIKQDNFQMDCVYAGPTKKSKRRLSMAVPGQPVRCVDKIIGKKTTAFCEVWPVGGESLGPVVWRMAEPVTGKVELQKFGLDMPLDAIRTQAQEEGYEIAESPATRRLSLTRPGTRLDIVLGGTSDVSREVILYSGSVEDDLNQRSFERAAVLRFGFNWEIHVQPNGGISKNAWYSDDRRIRIEFWPSTTPDEPDSLHLIDMR